MKILSFQPCSLYTNGGCGRVLRRLYEGREDEVISIAVSTAGQAPKPGNIKEALISLFPLHQNWMRWKLRDVNNYLQAKLLRGFNEGRIRKAMLTHSFDVLHTVNHGAYAAFPCRPEFITGKQLWVSFHDHYSLCSSCKDAALLWQQANRRLVISPELGNQYVKEFGEKDFEIITDGLYASEIAAPKQFTGNRLTIYFGGLLHWDYLPLFRVLADALDTITNEKNMQCKLVIRGAATIDFLKKRSFSVEYRNDFVSDAAISQELNEADILYLPIKFTNAAFYLYSLSTKMIGYLGAAGKILYHGPADSAACHLLQQHKAAVCCTTENAGDMIEKICSALADDSVGISKQAKQLARSHFSMTEIQKKFWQN